MLAADKKREQDEPNIENLNINDNEATLWMPDIKGQVGDKIQVGKEDININKPKSIKLSACIIGGIEFKLEAIFISDKDAE